MLGGGSGQQQGALRGSKRTHWRLGLLGRQRPRKVASALHPWVHGLFLRREACGAKSTAKMASSPFVLYDRGAQQFAPVLGGNSEGRDDDGACAVRASFGHKSVEPE